MKQAVGLFLALTIFSMQCVALSDSSVPTTTPVTPKSAVTPPTNPNTLPADTPIRMKLMQTISSGTNHTGDHISFEVLDDVKVNGVIAIAHGANALGTVTDAEPKRRLGRAGKLDVNLDYVR